MNRLTKAALLFVLSMTMLTTAVAQPAARRKQENTQKKSSPTSSLTTRAQISFPTAPKMEEDVVWRRDIYREIDLTKSNNSGLYYPVEPMGSQMNLFTYMFKLVLSGQVKAYKYRLDGNESFEESALIKPLTLLDDYHIYYERKDGKLRLDNSDIPSSEVKSYYIKETSYYDQKSSTFHTTVLALCPIMSREDDFGDAENRYPLFWVKYSDIAPYLSKQTIMTSDINNAAVMSLDDYFVKNRYEGKIYKTNNMLGRPLQAYCATDSAMAKEQKRIERELIAFEENIWGDKARKDSLDSIAKVNASLDPKALKKAAKTNRRAANANGQEGGVATSEVKQAKPKESSSSSGGSAARVTVRRQRH